MFSNKGEPILPSITSEGVRRQWESINKLRDYIDYTFIFAHFYIKDGTRMYISNLNTYIDKENRKCIYMKKMKNRKELNKCKLRR